MTQDATHDDRGGGVSTNEDEDEYMKMTFEDLQPARETSLQRTQRLKRESRQRGFIKSKAQKAKEEAAARDRTLSMSLLDDPKTKTSIGLSMMSKMGFTGGGLGKKAEDGNSEGRTEPIGITLKEDRGGVGLDTEKKRKLEEAAADKGITVKVPKLDPEEFRERVRKEKEVERLERQLHATQRMAERLDGGPGPETLERNPNRRRPKDSRPLKSFPVIYRGLLRYREEQERDRQKGEAMGQSFVRPLFFDYETEDADGEEALGKRHTFVSAFEDFDEEDPDLDRFNELALSDRIKQVLEHMRQVHSYCFWCKMTYEDCGMEGCPGVMEEDHD